MAPLIYNTESSDFSKLLHTSGFVDKTMLIKRLFEGKCVSLITAPPLFGKSTNLDMIRKFCELQVNEDGEAVGPVEATANYQLFKKHDLAVTKCPLTMRECGKYPVIHLRAKCDHRLRNFNDFADHCRKMIHESYKEHEYLLRNQFLSENERERIEMWCDEQRYKNLPSECVRSGLYYLARCMARIHLYRVDTFFDVLLLIDDYDSPVTKAMACLPHDEYDTCAKFYFDILATLCHHSNGVTLGVLAGVYQISFVDTGVVVRGFHEFLIDERMTPYFGLTRDEAKALLDRADVPNPVREKIDSMYGGYISLKGTHHMYNLWSVLNFLRDFSRVKNVKQNYEPSCYWDPGNALGYFDCFLDFVPVQFAILRWLTRAASFNATREYFVDIVQVYKMIHSSREFEDVVSYTPFMHLGYLSYVPISAHHKTTFMDATYKKKIPNDEVYAAFKKLLYTFYFDKYGIREANIDKCCCVLSNLCSGITVGSYQELKRAVEQLLSDRGQGVWGKNTLHSALYTVFCKLQADYDIFDGCYPKKAELILYKGNVALVMDVVLNEPPAHSSFRGLEIAPTWKIACYKKTDCTVAVKLNIGDVNRISVNVDYIAMLNSSL